MVTRRIFIAIVSLCLLLNGFTATAQEGRIVREIVYSPSLEGNLLGDSPRRPVTIYLPPSYDGGDNLAYPVVYLLHGYTGNNNLWTGGSYISGNIVTSMSSWLKNGKVKEMILVMPNSYNRLWGSYYTNSTATGNWADFIARDLVQYIDSNYRTLPQRESRAVIGHSMGAYGGLRIGMFYPDVFACMGGMAGDYDLEKQMNSNKATFAYISTIKDWAKISSLGFQAIWLAKAAAFAPNPDNPPFYCDFPFTYTDDKPREIVKDLDTYDRFMEHDTFRITEARTDILLNARAIYIDCGTSDGNVETARAIHDKLNDLGVNHVYKEFSGDHTCCVMTSTGNALEVFSNAMEFDMLVSVEPMSKLATMWANVKARN
jgi:S-formylglutathione hydrolase FrmB